MNTILWLIGELSDHIRKSLPRKTSSHKLQDWEKIPPDAVREPTIWSADIRILPGVIKRDEEISEGVM